MQTVFQYQREGKREPISSYVVLSNSPRRKELLKFLKPHITSVEVDERGIEEYFMNQFASDDFLTRAAKTCCEISKAKSEIKLAPEHLYISADTIVIADEQIFNKPKDLTEAEEMFRSYFGKIHYVVTSVCLRTSQSLDVFYALAQIDFIDYHPALEELIQSYIFENQPLDKAGAYGDQRQDPWCVTSSNGDVLAIVRLPVAEVSRRKFDDRDLER